MLAKYYRLSRREKIMFSRSLSFPLFLLRIGKNSLLYNRYRFVVSKRVDKRAVARNRMRRILSSCIESMKGIAQGYDLVFIIKKEALLSSRSNLCVKVSEALSKSNLLI